MAKKISELPAIAAFNPAVQFEVNDAGTSKRITGAQIDAGIGGGGGGGTDINNVEVVPFSSGDTRTTIQAAIDTVAAAGGGTVELEAGRTYEVSRVSNGASFRRVTPIRYCLVLKPGVKLRGNGSTIRQQNAQNAFILVNEGVTTNSGSGPTQRDADMGLEDIRFDGNRAGQSGSNDQGASPPYEEMGCIAMQSIDRFQLLNVRADNSQCYGARFADMFDCHFNGMYSEDVRGDAWALGLQQEGVVPLEANQCTFDNLIAIKCEGGYDFPGTGRSFIQGNPMIGCFVECTTGIMIGRNCGGGWKIENQSLRSSFDQLLFSGLVLPGEGNFNSDNSGCKIQGFAGGRPRGIQVNTVVSYLCDREGLRFTDCDDCHVENVYCLDCNQTNPSANQDIFVTGQRCSIGKLHLENSNNQGILINTANSHFTVGEIIANNLGGDLITWNAAGVTVLVGTCFADRTGRVFNSNASGDRLHCGVLAITGGTSDGDTRENNGNITYGIFMNNRPTT